MFRTRQSLGFTPKPDQDALSKSQVLNDPTRVLENISYHKASFGRADIMRALASLNPPKGADVSDKAFVEAVELAEQRLGLSKQPRVIVFHEKHGSVGVLRKHAHAVWSRIRQKFCDFFEKADPSASQRVTGN
jgi:hypothetical protein